jgi:hypothetical protein
MARFKGSSRFLALYRCEGPGTWIASNGSAGLTRQFQHMAFGAALALVNDFHKPRTSCSRRRPATRSVRQVATVCATARTAKAKLATVKHAVDRHGETGA